MRTEFANGRSRSQRSNDHSDYQRRRYNDREDRRRRDQDANGEEGTDFNASMYDDNAEPRQSRSRVSRGRRNTRNRSASPGRSTTNSDEIILDDPSASDNDRPSYRRNTNKTNRFRNRSPPPNYSINDPHPFPKANREKELFPSNNAATKSGQLASDILKQTQQKQAERAAAAAKLKKELFPHKTDRSNHRRSDAFDARSQADAANSDDLASRMSRRMELSDTNTNDTTTSRGNAHPASNAGKELFSPVPPPPSSSSSSAIHNAYAGNAAATRSGAGLNIRGTAGLAIKGGAGMSIKGAAATTTTTVAAAANVRELFPDKFVRGSGGGNEGKELFSDKIKGRGNVRRNRAEDLFG
jgi:hypothetical protein